MNVIQLAVGGLDANFSYLLHDRRSRDTALVDPCGDTRLIKTALARLPEAQPRYILLTHGHHDHWSGVREMRGGFAAPVAAHPRCPARHDLDLSDGERLPFGDTFVECLYAPGHSPDSVLYRLGDDTALFTGDTLFIGSVGRPDLMGEGMSAAALAEMGFNSWKNKLSKLPPSGPRRRRTRTCRPRSSPVSARR